jgi:tight adherence protein C
MLYELTASLPSFVEANMLPLIAAAIFGCVFFAALVIVQTAQARALVKKRSIAFNPAHAQPAHHGSGRRRTSQQGNEVEEASELLFAIEKGLSSSNTKRVSKIRRDLIRAGYFANDAILYYGLARVASACLLAFLVQALVRSVASNPSTSTLIASVVIGASLGLIIPAIYVRRRHEFLFQQCRNGFPTFLDLLVVCSEAGMTPRAGIERVSREITRTHPFLGANLFLMSLELRAGRPLAEAVEGLGRRVNLDEVRSFGSLLQQTEELGTNLTNTLRVFSEDMRARRFLRAEEKAYSLPVKLVLPLAFFVFPAVLVVTLMPVLIRMHKAFN